MQEGRLQPLLPWDDWESSYALMRSLDEGSSWRARAEAKSECTGRVIPFLGSVEKPGRSKSC
eukprot:scaffold59420_cov19-Tisochrysis_lutea.AAC.3